MLELNQVTKCYGQKLALNQVTLPLQEGIYGLLGPNGAGKSTMMNLITGNLTPTSGTITWNGQDIRSLGAEYRALLGYAPQQQGLYDSFTGRRFLSYMATLKGIAKRDIPSELERVLDYVHLTDVADRPIGGYSGGMKQRILIAQAILGDPKLLILDEPTAGLDPKERVRIREKIKAISAGKLILVSTHVVSDIQSITDQILLLKEGQLLAQDTVENLCQHYGTGSLEDVYLQLFEEDGHHEADWI